MATKGKRLILSTHHFYNDNNQVVWADVWIQVSVKPGRTVARFAPTLISLTDLQNSKKIFKNLNTEEEDAALSAFASGSNIFIGSGPEDMEQIYTSKPLIDRQHAAEMCLTYVNFKGIKAKRYKWKRSRYFSTPV